MEVYILYPLQRMINITAILRSWAKSWISRAVLHVLTCLTLLPGGQGRHPRWRSERIKGNSIHFNGKSWFKMRVWSENEFPLNSQQSTVLMILRLCSCSLVINRSAFWLQFMQLGHRRVKKKKKGHSGFKLHNPSLQSECTSIHKHAPNK